MSRGRLPAGVRVSSLTGISLRSLRARPLRSVLTAGAIMLGVGMVFGVLLLVGTIHSTFDRLYDSIYGKTDIVVSGDQSIGSLQGGVIDRIRAVRGVDAASGTVFSVFRTVDAGGDVRRGQMDQVFVSGVDYAQPDMTSAEHVAGRDPIPGRMEIQLPEDWAHKHGVGVGDRLALSTPTGVVDLRVSGLFSFKGGLDFGGYGLASMALADARKVMDKPQVWDEIDVTVQPGTSVDAVRGRIDATLGRGIEVVTPATKGEEAQKQIAALDVVLYFFSGIALFVGAFLILNSFNMTVLQRIREIGTLRALGATDARVVRAVLVEATVLGVVGSLLGLALGAGLAVLLIAAMRSFGMPVSTIDFSAGAAVAAVITGLVATVAGAAWPAMRAGRISPVRALIGAPAPRRALTRRRALVGLALFIPGMVIGGLFWFGTTSDSTWVGIGAAVATMVMMLGMVRLAPFAVLPLVQLLARPVRRVMPAEGRLAADAAQANPSRTAATAATLLVALSVVVVNATIASSFVGSVKSELAARLSRDLTVQPIGFVEYGGGPQAGISTALRETIAALPETGAVARRRVTFVPKLPGGDTPGTVVGYDPQEYRKVDKIDYTGAPVSTVLSGLASGGIVPAESYADGQGLHVGDRVRLEGPAGTRVVPVVGIAKTFDAGGQTVQMSLGTLAAVYGIQTDSQLLVKAAAPGQRAALARRVQALLAKDDPGLEALSNAEIKRKTTDAINQQFGFFNAIVGIAVLVGILGIVNTLTMSVMERTREIGVLRALGASRWRVRRAMADESLLVSLAGTISGILAGLGIGIVWVLGMRATTFPGMSMHLPVGMLASLAVLGVVIGVVAAILPARRAARLDPLTALRYE
ncbi:ABC transporter permease [Solirubrobacter soli]|uniref:ABC transporter permease n=1 Tax=Solirubrobacter soli TaxID=363832 RepID=UPI00040B664D|nr:FtsX-like permease family protein [Solirubrobacter soli]